MEDSKSNINSFISSLKEPTSGLIISILTLILSVPIFITFYKLVPVIYLPFSEGLRIDHILLFTIIFLLVYILIRKIAKLIYIVIAIALLSLLISTFTGNYGIRNLYYEYSAMLYNLNENGMKLIFEEKHDAFSKEAQIVVAVNYKDEEVRKTATNWAVKNFKAYQSVAPSLSVLHALSIFKEVRNRWNYVYDPEGEDYYAKASESLKQLEADDLLKGDCDDYSIVIAALVKATGGEVQLVRTIVHNDDGTQTGHLYPEVKIGDIKDLETYAYLIKNLLFPSESKEKAIFYYIDKEDNVWLNFDYNEYYPGGKYQSLLRKSEMEL